MDESATTLPTGVPTKTPDEYVFSVQTSAPLQLGTPPVFGPAVVMSSQSSKPNFSRFFRAANAACLDCATFIGDYNGLAVGSDGKIHSLWTDIRKPEATVQRPAGCGATPPSPVCVPTELFGQDAFYGSIPPPT
jgi:hypothetical protein